MDTELLQRVNDWLTRHRDEIIQDLIGLVRIPSVSVPDEQTPPFGQSCRDALQYMYDLAHRHGYGTRDYDHYVGAVLFGQGDEEIGIWTHLDVVPVPDPDEWDYPPFEGTLVEDRYLIGRGVQDNKAAAIGVFHVMNCLRELGVALKHRYALYMGTSEETGMEDARYFAAHYPCPDLSIVPDTGFPVCLAQRGSTRLMLSVPMDEALAVRQSNNPSVTPEELCVTLPDGRQLKATGDSAHVYAAKEARNAVVAMLWQLADALPQHASKLSALASLCSAWDGASLGMAYADELSGALCVAPTQLEYADGRLAVKLFAILPVSCDPDALLKRTRATAAAMDVKAERVSLRRPCSFPAEHPAVELLTRVYNEVVHADAKPFVMSGGNYAACLPNAFGFGPGMPGREFPPHIFRAGRGDYHQCDESEDVEHILAFMRVYAMSVAALNGIEHIKEK